MVPVVLHVDESVIVRSPEDERGLQFVWTAVDQGAEDADGFTPL